MAVVVLDSLTRRQWVKEDDLAKELKLHSKQLRRILRFFEEERLITRDHRRETAKGAKAFSAAVAATADGQQNGKETEEKMKLHTHSYCCIDYAQIYDVVRYRIHRMKKRLKDELEDRNTLQEYTCRNCNRRYSALDALLLVSYNEDSFHCENCNTELVAESDKLAAEEKGDGDDNGRRRRREKLRELLDKMEVQLKPLTEQLAKVKDLPVPDFGTLLQWEARALAGRATTGENNTNEGTKTSQTQGFTGTPMPYLGETKVEVALSGMETKAEDSKQDGTGLKVLPPWMITQAMNLTNEQRGEIKQESKSDGSKPFADTSEDRKPSVDDKSAAQQNIQEEYLKAYYAAIYKQQQEAAAAAAAAASQKTAERQVGMKAKREEEEDEIEWEESATEAKGHGEGNATVQSNVSNNQNMSAEKNASGEDDDDIDWE
eukprot:TRINITY_DN4565_c0_g1_i3.p1 TRINITY_DN4565_c0_g1~~TRINITY_DN4565_c0_g1_i3.p1  ORF type:complete len:432 (-),score=130.71 TRINITY_DN4565_c0_g1_i3:866-2161(-)